MATPEPFPFVSILVPARNEASHIETCVHSLLTQDYPRFEVIVVDDCSEDDTGGIVSRLASNDPRLILVRGTPTPDGWMGKAHALCQGHRLAQGEWLLFTDADTEHGRHLLSGVMDKILKARASFATVIGDQRHPTFGAYPANLAVFTYIFMFVDPKGWMNPRSRQSLVSGQYVVFSREAYEAIGTHAGVRQYSSTDVSLGYLAKMDGWVPLLIDGRGALTTTMYRDFRDAVQGWARSTVNGSWTVLGPVLGSIALIVGTALLCLFWIGPWVGLVEGLTRGHAVSYAASGLQIFAGLTLLRVAHQRWLPAIRDGLLMPVSFAIFVAIVVRGLLRAWLRGGTLWKGRVVRTTRRLPPWRPKATRNFVRS